MDLSQLQEINQRISELPSGGITYKTISGKKYAYYQWSEGGKQHARRVKDDELQTLNAQINERKVLQASIKENFKAEPKEEVIKVEKVEPVKTKREPKSAPVDNSQISTILTGDELFKFSSGASAYSKSSKVNEVLVNLQKDDFKFIVVYGLTRSGKTTIMLQSIMSLEEDEFSTAAYILASNKISMDKLTSDVEGLCKKGFKYIFIDEITSVADFTSCASTLLDRFSNYGVKFVLSGTDSFNFVLAEQDSLNSKFHVIRTTFLPYKDYLLTYPDNTVNDYIKSSSYYEKDNNSESNTFSNGDYPSDYLSNAVVRNVIHSVNNVDNDLLKAHYPDLDITTLKDKVLSTLEKYNYTFILRCLMSREATKDLGSLFSKYVTARGLVNLNEEEDKTVSEILNSLDLVNTYPEYNISTYETGFRTAFSQFGLRYALLDKINRLFTEDRIFAKLSYEEVQQIYKIINNSIYTNLVVDLCIKESSAVFPDKEFYSVTGLTDLVDFVAYDKLNNSYDIFKISKDNFVPYSVPKTFSNKEFINLCSHRFGTLNKSYYIYFGKNVDTRAVKYMNIKDYLKGNIAL